MFHYFTNCSSKAHQDSPTKGLSDLCQSDDLDLHAMSQLRLKLDNYWTCTIIVMYPTVFKLRHFDDLDLAARSLLLVAWHRKQKSGLNQFSKSSHVWWGFCFLSLTYLQNRELWNEISWPRRGSFVKQPTLFSPSAMLPEARNGRV